MASVSTDKNGRKRIQFVTGDGKRHSLYVGKVGKTVAREVGQHVDHLIRCCKTGEDPKRSTQDWMQRVPSEWPKVAKKLADLGLLNNGAKLDEVFADFVENYIASRKDVKPGTIRTWSQASQKVRTFFGRRTIKSLTVKDGKDFLRWLRTPKEQGGAGHKGETPSKHLGHVRGFLSEAVNAEIIPANPFRQVKAKRTPRRERRQLIPTDHVLRVIDVAPDAEMRAIIALAYWGGLRTPSEHFVLKWSAIRWDEGMMTILSPKTEGVGKESRETPLFPELVPYLLDLREITGDTKPDDYVIRKRRNHSEANVRNQMYRLCDKAGVERWPKIFQNLRSTRQTILERFYPRGTVCAWMGNTEDIAEAHYVQEMAEFRRQAADIPTTNATQGEFNSLPDKNSPNVAQNPAQKRPQGKRRDAKPRLASSETAQKKTLRFPGSTGNSQGLLAVAGCGQAEEDGNRTHQ